MLKGLKLGLLSMVPNLIPIVWLMGFMGFVGITIDMNNILIASIAIGLGAVAIEKHFTLDKTLPGPDHSFALNPDELKLMVQSVRKAENSIGTEIKNVLEIEKELSIFARRSIQAISKINQGDEFIEGVNFDILRPGKKLRGMEPHQIDLLKGKKSRNNIEEGDGILLDDIN